MKLRRLRAVVTAACVAMSLAASIPFARVYLHANGGRLDSEAIEQARFSIAQAMSTAARGEEVKDQPVWYRYADASQPPRAYNDSAVVPPFGVLFAKDVNEVRIERLRQGGRNFLAFAQPIKNGEGWATIVDLTDLDHQRSSARRWAVLASALLALLSGLVGWWLAGRVIRPARQALSERRGFLADAAHEMRTPLAVILASASQSLSRPRSSEEYVRSMAEIRAAAERASAGVNELLDLARLESGQAIPRRAPLRLDLLAEEVAASVRADDVVLTAEPGAAAVVVDADMALLRQAVDNVVRNAVRRATNVTLTTAIEGRDGILTVSDNGPGFDPAQLPHVFDRFRRGDARGEVGLGLSLVHAICAAHGGEVTAANRPEGGAAVTLRVPLSRLI
jgi:two-component system, OmpR family, sensor kinase